MSQLLPAAALGAGFAALAFLTTSASYAPGPAVAVTALYALLAVALWLTAAALARLGRLPALLGAALLAAATVWHLREQTRVPERAPEFAAAIAFCALLFWVLLVRLERGRRPGPAWAASAAAVALLAAALTTAYAASPTLRWHLLRHNKILGTPTFLAIGDPVAPVADRLWSGALASASPDPLQQLPPDPAPPAAPAIAVLLIDTLRADAFEAYGGDPALMPAFNRLAAGSLVFGDVTANASYTKSSVASLFTGLLPEEHGAVDHGYRLPGSWVTVAEALRARGYYTAAFVTNFANVGRSAGFDQGFEHFEELATAGSPYMRAEEVNRRVLAWLDEDSARRARPDARPLFLYVHYLDPHTPYLSGWEASARTAELRRGYDNELRYIDRTIPPFVETLEDTLGDARILITSDHGEEFGEHEESGHGHSLYRELVAVPALFRGSGVAPGRVDERLEVRDFFDFLLRIGGDFEAPDWARRSARETRYAAQYIDRGDAPLHRPDRRYTCTRSLERDGRRLIWSAYGDTLELYAASDPAESDNLAPAHPEAVSELRSELEGHPRRFTRRRAAQADPATTEMLRELGYIQ